MKKPIMRSGALSFPLFLLCVMATFLSPTLHAQDNALKDLSSRCHNEMQRVNGVENKKCTGNPNSQTHRNCMTAASATSTKAYETCMGGTPQGACAGREFLNTSRSGVQGLLDRYCALLKCGYNNSQVAALDLTQGRMIGGTGAGAIAAPPGFKWECPGAAQPAQKAQAAAPAANVGPDMGKCKSSPNFKSAGWKCADLKGQVGQFNKYDVPANERICTSSQIDTMVSANDVAMCSNIVEQGEAVLKKYRDADAAVDMGKCKPVSGVSSTGWPCSAVDGQISQYDKYNVPANERICTAVQARTMIARKDVANCSNVINQAEVVIAKYRKAAEGAAAAAAAAAKPKIDMGSCKPNPGMSNGGWECSALNGQAPQFEALKVPANERVCTTEQVTALIAANNKGDCSNVVEQREAVLSKYRKAAEAAKASATQAAMPRVDMGNCKTSPKFASRGWDCNALKGHDSQFEPLGVPAAERICTAEQINALVAAKDPAVCSNVVEQREAVLKSYRDKAKAAQEAAMGKCKPASGFDNTGFACVAVDAFLTEAAKYQVPAENRICTPEQAKALIAAKNDGHCSNVARQIAAATKRHRDAVAAAPKASTPAAAAPSAPSAQTATAAALEWTTLPGKAIDIGAGGNGQVWVVNPAKEIYRWNGNDWTRMPGAAVRLAVDGQGNAWVINPAGAIYQWAKNTWAQIPGGLADIGVGNNGAVWGVNAAKEIYRWTGSTWARAPGAAVRISVDPQGNAWVINPAGQIYSWQGRDWVRRPGAAIDVAACGNGNVYVVGTNNLPYKWNGSDWDRQPGDNLANIACDGQGRVFATTTTQQILAAKTTGAPNAPAAGSAKAAPSAQPATVAPQSQQATTVDMGKCKPVAGIDGKGWDCRQVMGAFDEYAKYNVPVAEQVCSLEQAKALVAAKNDANCGNVVVQVGKVLDKYRAAAAAANGMTINSASYGNNCPKASNADVTSKLKSACDGKEKCPYTVSAGVLGDTASGCAKAFEAEYTCPGKGKRKLSLTAEANNKIADFNCSK